MRYFFVFLLCLLIGMPVLAQDATPVEIGESVSGELSESQPEALYTFSGEQGQSIIITLTSDDFDAYLRLQDEAGDDIATDDDSAGGFNSQIGPLPLPTNDTYTVVATSLSGNATGSYTLTVDRSSVEPDDTEDMDTDSSMQTIEYGQTIEDELTSEVLARVYSFTGAEGDAVTIRLSSDEFDSYLTLQDSNGTTLLTDDDGAGSLNSLIGPYALPADDTYTIIASSLSGDAIGSYTLVFNTAAITSLAFDTPQEVTVETGGTYFQFDAEAGQVIDIVAESGDTVDTKMSLHSPSNYEVASDDDSGGSFDPAIRNFAVVETGTYTLLLSPYSEFDTGDVTVTLTSVELESLDDGPQVLKLNEKQNHALVTFEGVADQPVRLTFEIDSEDDYASPSVTLTQAGSSLSYNSFTNVQEVSFVTVIPDDGPVTITVENYSYTNISITVTLEAIE
ncbi:MAG: PPC domain-containing protein [Anaerolineae bacterium]|nr:PPC domain-containing protein [Anaerolineae bacterium]